MAKRKTTTPHNLTPPAPPTLIPASGAEGTPETRVIGDAMRLPKGFELLVPATDAEIEEWASAVAGEDEPGKNFADRVGLGNKDGREAERLLAASQTADFKTATLDAYHQAYEDERLDPDVMEMFPVWRWSHSGQTVESGGRANHIARDGKYYPASVSFQDVRTREIGEVAGCACQPIATFIGDWEKLQAQGVTVESPPWQ